MASGNRVVERTDPRRVEWVAVFGLGLQALAALVALLMSLGAGGYALKFLTVQAVAGVLFWGVAWLHLRLKRLAREEAEENERMERRRQASGMESLFDEPETGNAVRNLRQMEKILVPVWSFVIGIVLLSPLWYFLLQGLNPWTVIGPAPGMHGDSALLCAFVALGSAFLMFLCGAYASGLSRAKGCSVIRAGGGYMLSSALAFVTAAVALFMCNRAWGTDWPDDVVSGLIILWMAFQAVEILANLLLDIYRPRVAGVESRPAYDSRISGLLAEPTGLFRTFAHTMDYQFGFKISETWFFQFIEKAFAPLVLVWLLTFYLLTCLVVVRPGEVVIIERFGAPLGFSALPADDADWDSQLPEPLGPGLHAKLPWPIDVAHVMPRETVRVLYAGFGAADEADAEEKALELASKLITWDAEHIADENFYLMPMPVEMRSAAPGASTRPSPEGAADAGNRPAGADGDGGSWLSEAIPQVDALFLSGSFTLLYRVGARPGDPYRYAYSTTDPVKALRSIFEREITAHLAGAQFWDVMVDQPGVAEKAILAKVKGEALKQKLGIEPLGVQVTNLHPPAGDVGKSFQEVLSARQEKQTAILNGEADQKKILGLIPSQTLELVAKAESDRHEHLTRARAEADLFRSRVTAWRAAPEVYMNRARNEALMSALQASGRLIIHPPGVEVRLDDTKVMSSAELNLITGITGEIAKETR